MSEAEEIDRLIEDYGTASLAFGVSGKEEHLKWLRKAKEAWKTKIQSIITERDQLRKAANEDLICEQMIEDEIAKMNRNAAQRSKANV